MLRPANRVNYNVKKLNIRRFSFISFAFFSKMSMKQICMADGEDFARRLANISLYEEVSNTVSSSHHIIWRPNCKTRRRKIAAVCKVWSWYFFCCTFQLGLLSIFEGFLIDCQFFVSFAILARQFVFVDPDMIRHCVPVMCLSCHHRGQVLNSA